MASSREYLDFILEQLSSLDEISYKMMMGEYIIYYRGRIAAYICDDRLLIKPVPAARTHMPDAVFEAPYEGAKPMFLADNVDDAARLCSLFDAIYGELTPPKQKK